MKRRERESDSCPKLDGGMDGDTSKGIDPCNAHIIPRGSCHSLSLPFYLCITVDLSLCLWIGDTPLKSPGMEYSILE